MTAGGKQKGKWTPVVILGAAQFIMVLDTTVMNVSISAVVKDLNTTVAGVQLAITCYALVMGAFMLTGGRLGDILGRRKGFAIGLMIYGIGSLITSLSPNLPTLLFGWSLIEGLGATLVIPAIMALTAAAYEGKDRALAYGILGGVAGAGAAAGPLIGGFVTTNFSWRYVFAGETVVVVLLLIVGLSKVANPAPVKGRISPADVILSAVGMAAIVLGVLQASSWGVILPKNPPVISGHELTPLGLSPVPFIVGFGVLVFAIYLRRAKRVEDSGGSPLMKPSLLKIPQLSGGLAMMGSIQLILAGTFFVLPVFLQLTLGKDALQTGISILPLSIGLVIASVIGSRLAVTKSPKAVVQIGILILAAGLILLVDQITPDFKSASFSIGMLIVGSGMGMVLSQMGNVIMSAVDEKSTGEAGGLQGTAQNLGFALGTALIGGILLSGLTTSFQTKVAADPAIPKSVQTVVAQGTEAGVQIVSEAEAKAAAENAGLNAKQVDEVTAHYMDAQISALKLSLAVLAILSLLALFVARRLPAEPAGAEASPGSPRAGPEPLPAPTAS